MKKAVKNILINIAVFFLLFEIVSVLYIKIKKPVDERYDQIPTYLSFSFKDSYDTLTDPISPKVIDTAYPWCTWHPLNSVHRQASQCYDVILRFNELGTRGQIPPPDDSSTIFFVGDSFAEGFGVQEDSTVPERIKKTLNKPVLNLGTSGSIGTTQMNLIYKYFARKFTHKKVYVLLFLSNDFTDNDIRDHDSEYTGRYRPYRVFNGDSSSIIYKGDINSTPLSWKEFEKHKAAKFTKLKKYSIKSFFKTEGNFLSKLTQLTYSRRFISFILGSIKNKPSKTPRELGYDSTDWKILNTDIRDITKTADSLGATVTFINLPSRDILQLSKNEAEKYRAVETKLTESVSNAGGRYLSFYDYLSSAKTRVEEMFFTCNNHYSDYGNRLLTEFILKNYK